MSTTRRDAIKGTLSAIAVRSVGAPLAAGIASCGGGGGGGSASAAPGIAAPSALSYPSPGQGTVGVPLTTLTPTVAGTVSSYSITPPLPAGLTLNPTTGAISGTPTSVATQGAYTITASNASGSTTFVLSLAVNAALAISAVSNSNPTALTPISLSTTGLDTTKPFTVTLSLESGNSVALTPIRSSPDGTVVIATPPYFDPKSGLTTSTTANIQISQNSATSNAVPITIQDLPAIATYGATPGQISRGFLNYLTLSLARSLNHFQAMAAVPTNTIDTSSVQNSLKQQIIDTIEMRDNIDLIMSGSQTSLAVGTTATGDPINFDQNSIDMMDRMLGLHLQAVGFFTNAAFPVATTKAGRSAARIHAILHPLAGNAVADTLGILGSTVGIISGEVNAFQPVKSDNTLGDNVVSGLSGLASLAGLVGLAAEAPVVVTAAAVVGAALGAYTVGRDIYNIYESPEGLTWANGSKTLFDAAGTVASLFGAKAVGSGLVSDVTSYLANTGSNGAASVVLQGSGFISNLGTLTLGIVGLAGSAASQDAANVPPTQYGAVTGSAFVSNAQGPILSGLPGVYLTDPATGVQFYAIADASGAYQISLPLGVSALNYSGMQLQTFDPVTGTLTGQPITIDLSGLTANQPDQAPSVTGQCVDTDAGAPDADDPDCD